jgi:hypothetical protein
MRSMVGVGNSEMLASPHLSGMHLLMITDCGKSAVWTNTWLHISGAAHAVAAAAAAKREVTAFMQGVEMGHEQLAAREQASRQLDWNW